ncbi:MAG: zinc-binding dehydrogenase [Gammaproteobacteria bacterium]|nr:zinc-binding dehydrogenase [Gammaproteobacteria bacterium]
MKAAVINQFGDTDVLKFEDIAVPSPKPGHILIKVLAAGTNRLEHYLREGSVVPELPFPHILGADAAGEVARLGQGVEGFDIGERVIPMPGFPTDEKDYDIYPASLAPSFTLPGLGIWGTYAQYIEVPARYTLKDDTGLSAEEVATLPMALATAVRAVKEIGNVKAGDKVLVQAGASGSGSMQVQVAKALGAEVVTTVRDDAKGELVRSIGADLVINTRNEDLVEKVMAWTDGRGVDVAIDNVGGDVLAKSIDAVKATGVVVAFGFTAGTEVTFDIRNFFFGQKQLRGSMGSDLKDLQWGLEQVKTGKIKPVLDRVLPLSQAAEAHYLIANNRVSGNIVLQPWSE